MSNIIDASMGDGQKVRDTTIKRLSTACLLISVSPLILGLIFALILAVKCDDGLTFFSFVLGFVGGFSLRAAFILWFTVFLSLGLAVTVRVLTRGMTRKFPSYKILRTGMVIAFVILFFVTFFHVAAHFKLHEYCEKTGVTFPQSTRLHFLWELVGFAGSETAVYLKITMDKKDVAAFIEPSPRYKIIGPNPLPKQTLPNDFLYRAVHTRDVPFGVIFGWDPDSAKNYWSTSDREAGEVLVDLDHPNKATIYIVAMYW